MELTASSLMACWGYSATIWIEERGDQDGDWLSRRDDDCRAATEMQELS
jgi:hypothetical protein